MLTGESVPLVKKRGSSVVAGTTNQTGALEVRVDALPAESTAAQLTHSSCPRRRRRAASASRRSSASPRCTPSPYPYPYPYP